MLEQAEELAKSPAGDSSPAKPRPAERRRLPIRMGLRARHHERRWRLVVAPNRSELGAP
jgi:hypothetical protein